MWLILNSRVVGLCASAESVSELDHCQIGMTAIVMGDVNAVYTLGRAHRRQLLAARALSERSLLVRGLSFPRTKTIGDVYIDDLVICSILQFSDAHVDSSPTEVQRADDLYDFLQKPTHVGMSGGTLSGEFWEGRLDGVSGALGFPLERRVSLMLVTMLLSAMDVNRTLLRRLLRGWAFALTFRHEVFASLDLSCIAAATLPPSRRCPVNGALLDEFLLVTGLAPLLQPNLRVDPCETLHATGADGSSASITLADWLALYDLAEEKGERVRLDVKGERPLSNMHDGRAAAPLALELNWARMLSYRFFEGQTYQSLGTGQPDQPPQAGHT